MSIAIDQTCLDSTNGLSPKFEPTQWTLVRRASLGSPQSRDALETLCRAYWFPIYAFIRRHGRSPHDAQDLTQEFLVRFLETDSFRRAVPERGRFRTFLLAALKNFLTDVHRRASAWKRGGGVKTLSFEETEAEERYRLEPVDNRTPDQVYQQRWLVELLDRAMARLRDEFHNAGKQRQFQVLKTFLSQEGDDESYEQAGAQLDTSAKTIAVAVHRLRRRFRQVVRSVIADTVSSPEEIEEEYRTLFA